MTTVVTPRTTVRWPVVATLLSPVSHHDPDTKAALTNLLPFRRRAHLVTLDTTLPQPTQAELDTVLAAYPIPTAIAPYFTQLSAPQFLAVAVTFAFINLFRSADGEGIFSGIERYQRLSSRLERCASSNNNLSAFWSALTHSMQVGGRGETHERLLTLLSLPPSLDLRILSTLSKEAETSIMRARLWQDTLRLQDAGYAEKAKKPVASAAMTTLSYSVGSLPPPVASVIRQIPAVTGNSVRHSLVRAPGMLHLLDRLSIGLHELSESVGAMLDDGSAIRKGTKVPDNEHALGQRIIQRYPLLELVSGCTDLFLLPESVLRVESWLVCREHAEALARFDIIPDQPAEALIDQESLLHDSKAFWRGESMPYGFETLIEGAQITCVFTLTPYASELAAGALAAAIRTIEDMPRLGGQGARGYGAVSLGFPPGLRAEMDRTLTRYEAVLAEETEELRAGLLDGTLCTGVQVCAARKRGDA